MLSLPFSSRRSTLRLAQYEDAACKLWAWALHARRFYPRHDAEPVLCHHQKDRSVTDTAITYRQYIDLRVHIVKTRGYHTAQRMLTDLMLKYPEHEKQRVFRYTGGQVVAEHDQG